jgi:hypothetical protein
MLLSQNSPVRGGKKGMQEEEMEEREECNKTKRMISTEDKPEVKKMTSRLKS